MVTHNYHAFFGLYQTAPHLSAYLMDFMLQRVRNGALKQIVAAYRPSVSVEQLRQWLGFADLEETRLYLRHVGVVFVTEKGSSLPLHVDCKASQERIKLS